MSYKELEDWFQEIKKRDRELLTDKFKDIDANKNTEKNKDNQSEAE